MKTMKLSLIVFAIAAFYANFVFGLGEFGDTSYKVLPGSKRCKALTPACCSHASRCTIRYQAKGTWVTLQDRTATEDACKGVCGIHFKKCIDLCDCVTRQREVRSTQFCKCKLAVPHIFVRNNCIRRCIDARNRCVKDCTTKRCPLKAVTKMSWDQEFLGRCDAICRRQNHLSSVCLLTAEQ